MTQAIRDRLVAVFLIGIGGYAIYQALGFRGDGDVFPIAMATALIGACLLKLVRPSGRTDEPDAAPPVSWARFAILGAASIAMLLSAGTLGFYVVIPAFVLATLLILSGQGLVASLAITVLFTLGIFITFELLLEVPVPAGLLENLIR
ncbi:MAG: tripartite tricarboxylate transporter TctB family protein [Tropicimonas sp.]|uniref:tripartite tricarboxylate transporter TctB family protein n=1 Tax=Tropicimonas sp. TaxID=2067044 RepID=UPI003A8BEEDC